jgi:hypothetical protein
VSILVGIAVLVLAAAARHDLGRLGPLVRPPAPGLVPAAFLVAVAGFVAQITAVILAALAS